MEPREATAHMRSRIRLEEPEPGNPFAARAAYCHGYDVFGDMLGRAGWSDMIFLLFRGEAPTPAQAGMLEALAVALADPGPRDASVHAAMCGGVGGSPAAASLMAALAVGAGSHGGGREIVLAMEAWTACGFDLDRWTARLAGPPEDPRSPAGIWPRASHAPGFDPHGTGPSTPVGQLLACLAGLDPASRCAWLLRHRASLEAAAGRPLSLAGAAAAALADLGFSAAEAEMLYLLLRLPGAAAHALEQAEFGHKRFPFYAIELEDGPAGGKP